MGKIEFKTGDATCPKIDGNIVIAQVNNNIGKWGKGFVVAVSRRWPEVKDVYLNKYNREGLKLGETQFVLVKKEPSIYIANMVAQNGINDGARGWRGDLMDYQALDKCLEDVCCFTKMSQSTLHMPRIGCGLAGSSWDKIEPYLIYPIQKYGVDCYVYDLP